jgi:hypothetical protein
LYRQKGFGIPPAAAFGKIGDAYVAEVHRWAKTNGVPGAPVRQGREQRADRPHADRCRREGGRRRAGGADRQRSGKDPNVAVMEGQGKEHAAHPHMEGGRQMGFANHSHFYLQDPEWSGAFLKTNAYAPWPVWIWLNGHTWAQWQCERLGIGDIALDNGFRDCESPKMLQQICARLGSGAVKSFWRWQKRLPSALTREHLHAVDVGAVEVSGVSNPVFVVEPPEFGMAASDGDVVEEYCAVGVAAACCDRIGRQKTGTRHGAADNLQRAGSENGTWDGGRCPRGGFGWTHQRRRPCCASASCSNPPPHARNTENCAVVGGVFGEVAKQHSGQRAA